MNAYLNWAKARMIRLASSDLLREQKINLIPWTKKIYFYFVEIGNKKWVHKESLRFVYSNGDTYTNEREPEYCGLTKQFEPVDVVKFLEEYRGDLLPSYVDAGSFLVFDYIEGEPVDSISRDEFFYLLAEDNKMELTPFYNSMTYNLVRGDRLTLVDLKHFDHPKDLPFFVYFYNLEHGINRLYVENGTDVAGIFGHLMVDYPVANAEIIRYD